MTSNLSSPPFAEHRGARAAPSIPEVPNTQQRQQFEALLNPLWGPFVVAPPPQVAPLSAALAGTAHHERVTLPAQAPGPGPGPQPGVAPEGEQAAALRVSSGPLAGLVLRLCWRAPQLRLRLETADAALAGRMQAQHPALALALAQTLGVSVQVTVGAPDVS